MLFTYFKDLFSRIKKSKTRSKVLISLFLLLEIFILVICFTYVDYEIYTPGYINNAASVVTIGENTDEINSLTTKNNQIYTVSVFSYNKTSLIKYWLAKNNNIVALEKKSTTYSDEQLNQYGITCKKTSINNAIMFAYNKAKEVDPTITLVAPFQGMLINLISTKDTELKADDIITKVEGETFTNREEFLKIYDVLLGEDRLGGTKKKGDAITYSIERYDSTQKKYLTYEKSTRIGEDTDGHLSTFLVLEEHYALDGKNSTPSFTINYNEERDSSGNSGGAMLALSIYNKLLKGSITDKFVCGTGTISLDGTIGPIGAIEQKVTTAFKQKAEYFFVDKEDFDAAIAAANLYGYDNTFIKCVNTFDDILNILGKE